MGGKGSGEGGRREGAGRKPLLRAPRKVTVAIEDVQVRELQHVREQNRIPTLAETVRYVLRDWLQRPR